MMQLNESALCLANFFGMSLSRFSLAYVSIQHGLFKGFRGRSALRVLDCALKRTVFELTFVSKDVMIRLMIRANLKFNVFLVASKSKHCHKCNFLTSAFVGIPIGTNTKCIVISEYKLSTITSLSF